MGFFSAEEVLGKGPVDDGDFGSVGCFVAKSRPASRGIPMVSK